MKPELASSAARPASQTPSARGPLIERLVVGHAALLAVVSTWALAGSTPRAELAIAALGSLGLVGTIAAFVWRVRTGQSLQPFHWLWPLLAFAMASALGFIHPSFSSATIEGATVFLPRATSPFLPGAARPDIGIRVLTLFFALYLPAFNLVVAVRSRRMLRRLLWIVFLNGVVLAIFGSFQKLVHSPGLFFGAIHSPNTRFFATFIYQNHWGAYALLVLCSGIGLVFHATGERRYRNFFQSPAFLGLIAVLLLAASVPLSASRSCTLLVSLLGTAAFVHGLRRLLQRKRLDAASALPTAAMLAALALTAIAAIYQLAWPVISARVEDTRQQVAQMRQVGSIGARATLYHDTYHMAADRPLFGWGLGSYPTVFTRYNSQVSTDRLPIYYEDAHSDWLQSLAENGVIGTLCLIVLVGLPLIEVGRCRPLHTLPSYLLVGCATVIAYATIEFPFGNHAVVYSFWLYFFTAVRLAQLDARERN